VANQAFLEEARDKLPLLSSALPEGPNVNKVLNDIQTAASDSVRLDKISVQEISLVESKTKVKKSFVVQAETASNFSQVVNFTRALQNQRRLKNIKIISIDAAGGSEATGSGNLNIKIEVEGFYL
jgi:Tfp pilus assembly protein PilO